MGVRKRFRVFFPGGSGVRFISGLVLVHSNGCHLIPEALRALNSKFSRFTTRRPMCEVEVGTTEVLWR